jgi:outer membrane protein TolC
VWEEGVVRWMGAEGVGVGCWGEPMGGLCLVFEPCLVDSALFRVNPEHRQPIAKRNISRAVGYTSTPSIHGSSPLRFQNQTNTNPALPRARSWPRFTLLTVGGVLALLAVALVQGCAIGLDGVDRRVERLLAERSASIRAAQPSEHGHQPAADYANAKQDVSEPNTINPVSGEIEFTPSDPKRDASAKLRAFAREESGIDKNIEPLVLTLNDAFALAQKSGREFLNAEEDYILVAIRLLMEQHRWGPRLFNDTTVSVAGNLDDGDVSSALRVMNDLRVTQRLPSGGSVEARWVWTATENLRNTVSKRYQQSSRIVLSGNAPLLRGAGPVARESIVQSERNLVYQARNFERFRRQFLVNIARDYFSLLESKAEIANQKETIRILANQLERDIAYWKSGKSALFDVNNTQNDLLAAVSTLDNLVDRYSTELDRFKIRLGLDVDQPVRVTNNVFDLTEPQIQLDEAVRRAFDFRLDLQNDRDRVDDARRSVRNARNNILPDLNFTADVTVPTDPDVREGGLGFDPDDLIYATGVTFGLPLDREIERLELRSAVIRIEQEIRDFRVTEDNVYVDARAAVRGIERARSDLVLAEQRVAITRRRFEQQQILEDEVTNQQKLDTAQALLRALNARDRAETRVRTSILDYLLVTGQMRVDRGGQLEALPGLDVAPVQIFSDTMELDDWYESPIDEAMRERLKTDLVKEEGAEDEPGAGEVAPGAGEGGGG